MMRKLSEKQRSFAARVTPMARCGVLALAWTFAGLFTPEYSEAAECKYFGRDYTVGSRACECPSLFDITDGDKKGYRLVSRRLECKRINEEVVWSAKFDKEVDKYCVDVSATASKFETAFGMLGPVIDAASSMYCSDGNVTNITVAK